MVREELDRLPDSYRQPLTLCYIEGLTHRKRRVGWVGPSAQSRCVSSAAVGCCVSDSIAAARVWAAECCFWLLDPGQAATVPEPLLESTVRVMTLGRRRTVGRRSDRISLAHCGWPTPSLGVPERLSRFTGSGLLLTWQRSCSD